MGGKKNGGPYTSVNKEKRMRRKDKGRERERKKSRLQARGGRIGQNRGKEQRQHRGGGKENLKSSSSQKEA